MPEYGEGYVLKESLIILTEWDNDIEKWVILDDDLEFLMTEKNDVAPVVHAQWRYVGSNWECSNCLFPVYSKSKYYHYCPQCGARMGGEE